MDVDNPRELESFLVPNRELNRKIRWMNNATHVAAKNAAINFKISVSLLLVSSKPGVSIRITPRPSRENSSAR